jgi:hypothetical protein
LLALMFGFVGDDLGFRVACHEEVGS